MKKLLMPSFIAFVLISCADLTQDREQKKVQNGINQALSKKTEKLSNCARHHNIFERLKSEEVQIEVHLVINENGRMDKFTIENDRSYPSEFIDCLFNTLDEVEFPKSHPGETIELDQP